MKLSCNAGPSEGCNAGLPIASNFCCNETEPRKLQTPSTIGTWNVKSINQCKLEVVKQEMERVNINTVRISELKRTGVDDFHSDEHYIYYRGQESLRRKEVDLIINKRVQSKISQSVYLLSYF